MGVPVWPTSGEACIVLTLSSFRVVCLLGVCMHVHVCVVKASLHSNRTMNCATSGFPTLCHYELKDFTATDTL